MHTSNVQQSAAVSVEVSKLGCSELILVELGVKKTETY